MRGYGWKISLIAIIFCYPVGSLVARLVEYIGLTQQTDPTTTDQFQMLRIGNAFLVTILVIGWLIAFVAGMESWGADDDVERWLSRFAFIIVLIVTVVFLANFGLGRQIQALT
jgi:phosphoglycerol transferase MdoB-like AlkP superfamily enzyme